MRFLKFTIVLVIVVFLLLGASSLVMETSLTTSGASVSAYSISFEGGAIRKRIGSLN